jgi:hypothetical protein
MNSVFEMNAAFVGGLVLHFTNTVTYPEGRLVAA